MEVQQTWARYVRNRWQRNTLSEAQYEWALTVGEARNLIYGHVSLKTLEKIAQHKNGGFRLELDMLLTRWRTSLETYADQLEEENARARADQEARARAGRLVASRLADRESQAGAVAAPDVGAP